MTQLSMCNLPVTQQGEPMDDIRFAAGKNIALKVPRYRAAATERFYRDVLGLPLLGRTAASGAFPNGSPAFDFGGTRLWVDDVASADRGDVWLQVTVTDLERAMRHLTAARVPVRDELEPLGDFPGHWISDPAGTILLVAQEGAQTPLDGPA
jgi:catechol 2,3-dioxygenase-like lactoylglutathione lyase family enzyme